MEQENKVRLEKHGDFILIDIQGDVTTFSEPFLNEAYNNANDQGASKILLKFDSNAYINSGGIGIIIQLLAESKTKNQQIGITGISDHFKKIFSLVGVTKFARIYDSVDEALKSFSGSE